VSAGPGAGNAYKRYVLVHGEDQDQNKATALEVTRDTQGMLALHHPNDIGTRSRSGVAKSNRIIVTIKRALIQCNMLHMGHPVGL
jgi:hypothetical protein